MRLSRLVFRYLLALLFAVGSGNLYASHIFAGDLLYKHISGNKYVLTMTLFGDCASVVSSSLPSATPQIYIYNGVSFWKMVSLPVVAPSEGVEVSPVCPKELNNTTCKSGTLPGVKKFVYRDTVELPAASANWRFVFVGTLGSGGLAGRSNNISNIQNAGSTKTYLEATLNNVAGPNSSPEYTSIPTPFYCMLEDQQFGLGAVDTASDSLVFELVPALDGNPNTLPESPGVAYISPYTAEVPIVTSAGGFTFSGLNGQLTFSPSISQSALVVYKVYEYRNGVLVGTSQREMTFIISPDCEGTPPTLKVVNVVGGAITGKNVVNICVGTPSVAFGISVSNPDKDTTIITQRNVPAGAVLAVAANNTPRPIIQFTWNGTDTLKPGAYTFFLDVKNDHCPIANRQTIAYTINVTPYPTVGVTETEPTRCVYLAKLQYDLAYGYLPRTVTILAGTKTVATYTDTTGKIIDSLPVGNYTIVASSSPLCVVSSNFSVVDSGVLPQVSSVVEVCQRDSVRVLEVPVYGTASVVTWYDAGNNVLASAPVISTSEPGTREWYFTEQYKACTSQKDTVKVIVHPLPVPQVLTNPATICYGDTLFLEASGGVKYIWTPEDRVMETADGRPFARLTRPGQFTVEAITEYGCADSVNITYKNIQSCCTFVYPNAFTPNSDGKNDGFRVFSPGNLMNYKLVVYNRWGQVVFMSYNPDEYWDGTQQQVPCEPGTYFYFFEGMCLTGTQERHKGDVTLIR